MPVNLELYDRTHKMEKGKGDYICPKAKKVRVRFTELQYLVASLCRCNIEYLVRF